MSILFWLFSLIVVGYIVILISYLFVRINKFKIYSYSFKNYFSLLMLLGVIVLFYLFEIYLNFLNQELLLILSYTFLFIFVVIILFKSLFIIIQSIRFKFMKQLSIQKEPFVSVIVPIFRKEKIISKSINSILNNNYLNKEIIAVYDDENDLAVKILKKEFNGKIKLIKNISRGKWSALNTGIKNAKGEIIVNVDSDTIIEKDGIENLVKNLLKQNVDAIGSNVVVKNNFIIEKEYQINVVERRLVLAPNGFSLIAGNFGAFKKESFEKINYSNKTLCEDFDLVQEFHKQNLKTSFAQDVIAYDSLPMNFVNFIKQRNRWFRGIVQVVNNNRKFSWKNIWINFNLLEMPIFSQIIFIWFIIFFFLTNNYSLFFLFFTMFFISDLISITIISKDNIFKTIFYTLMFQIYIYYLNFIKVICTIEELAKFKVKWEKI